MAKRGGFPGMPGGGNMQNLLKQAQQMQQDMMKAQEELDVAEYAASAGGGMVTATVNGKKVLQSIKINPEVVDPDDVEMLEDLVMAAVNEAVAQADKAAQEKMGAFASGMPNMF